MTSEGAPSPWLESRQGWIESRKARTRDALVAAAQELIAEGRLSPSIQEITARAGVGFGSFTNHFDSKDALFRAAVSATLTRFAAQIRDLVHEIEDPAEAFAASFRLGGRSQRLMPDQIRIILHAGTAILVESNGVADFVRADLRRAVEAGRFDLDDIEQGAFLVGGTLLAVLQLLEAEPGLDDSAVVDRFAVQLLRALGLDTDDARAICARPLPRTS